jgi:hypothetical protein
MLCVNVTLTDRDPHLSRSWLADNRAGVAGKLLRATALTSLLLGTTLAANAADLPPAPRAPVPYMPVAVPVFSWTGFYIGGNLGGG